MKAAFFTLGCKTNSYDTQAMQTVLKEAGYEIVEDIAQADVVVINTCAVTNVSEAKSRQAIRRAVKQNKEAVIVAAGCYSQLNCEEVAALEGVDAVVGIQDRVLLADIIDRARHQKVSAVRDMALEKCYEPLAIASYSDQTRAFIKIQEGCDRYCAYCIIPYARGISRSRALSDILSEVWALAGNGYKEIVITGIHIASYGKDLAEDVALIDVIEAVAATGIKRIRLGSLEPKLLDSAFLKRLQAVGQFCPSFHISLQSGCDGTLKRMGRRYTTAEYFAIVENVRAYFPHCSITTDVIVGFPQESEADFQATMMFCKQAGFMKVHVFPYSKKRGTRAAELNGQILTKEKEARSRRLVALSDELGAAFYAAQCGKVEEVLFEREKDGFYEGYTKNYLHCKVQATEALQGEIRRVRFTAAQGDVMYGVLLNDAILEEK